MLKNLFLLAAILTLSVAAFAQTDDYSKFEVFGGYSNNQVDSGTSDDDNDIRDFFEDRQSFNGFNVSATGNFSRYVGVRGDISGHYKEFGFDLPRVGTTPATRFEVDSSIHNFLGGVQVKDNAREGSRLRPFGYGLIGVARGKSEIDNSVLSSAFCQQAGVDCRDEINNTSTGFAAAIGGGLDIKASRRISVRAIQFDYNPTRLNDSTQNNFRFGFGVVFH